MKIRNFILLITFLIPCLNYGMSSQQIVSSNRLFNIIKTVGCVGTSLASIKFAMPEGTPSETEAIPKYVEDWCRKVLSDHNINIDGLTFAKTNKNCAMEAGVKRISIAPKTLKRLEDLLKDNLNFKTAQYYKNYYTFALLHEAGHILDRHKQKSIVFSSLFFSIILNYCLDTFKGNLQGNKILEKNSICKALIIEVISIFLGIKSVRYHESFADEFARKLCTISDTDILNIQLYNSEQGFSELIEKIQSTKPIWFMVNWLYKKTNKNDVSFEEWLKDNPRISKILFCILIDFRHEYPIDSIKKLKQRKQELLNEQENLKFIKSKL